MKEWYPVWITAKDSWLVLFLMECTSSTFFFSQTNNQNGHLKNVSRPDKVAQTYNPSYLGGRDQEDCSWRQT
jgi:hypothetical protein